jgi:hypothetical protein
VPSIGELKGGPLSTKRALRTIPKAVDSYAREPEQMAHTNAKMMPHNEMASALRPSQ